MKYDWKDAGEEWSEPWGSSAAQWEHAILPRIQDALPAGTILEIGCGYGRWSHYLRQYCQRLWLIDRVPQCIEACQARFPNDPNVHCVLNDGRSLAMVPDGSVDFVFSFDVFVHLKPRVVENYLRELASKLTPAGRGFIHHSNLGEYAGALWERWPRPVSKILRALKILDWEHHRDPEMKSELFRELAARAGLQCPGQELVNWRGRRLIDCFSWIEPANAGARAETQVVRNPRFMREAADIRRDYFKE
jgi:SAM-dependent methyltransferase